MIIQTPVEPERWAAHPDHPFYDISTHGRVRSWKRVVRGSRTEPQYLRPQMGGDGYLTVNLDRKTTNIHKAVLIAHVGQPAKGWCTRHLNGIKTDNRLENLAWGSYSQNARDMYDHGTMKLGEERLNSKLTDRMVIEARLLRSMGLSIKRLADGFGVSPDVMAKALRGDTWRHLPGAVSLPRAKRDRHLTVVR